MPFDCTDPIRHYEWPRVENETLASGKVVRFTFDLSLFINTQITHNYGHGGMGFALHWGTAKHAIDCFEESRRKHAKL